jgi:hypothetical protein
MFEGKIILSVLCHPDDEVICGWPIFQNIGISKKALFLCDDSKRRGQLRVDALKASALKNNFEIVDVLTEDNNFYALPTRYSYQLFMDSVIRINKAIELAVEYTKPDYIFTHNPVGEYGHGSHRLAFELVSQHEKARNVIFTDIAMYNDTHRSSDTIPESVKKGYYQNLICTTKISMAFYNRGKRIYSQYDSWTWSTKQNDNVKAGIYAI